MFGVTDALFQPDRYIRMKTKVLSYYSS